MDVHLQEGGREVEVGIDLESGPLSQINTAPENTTGEPIAPPYMYASCTTKQITALLQNTSTADLQDQTRPDQIRSMAQSSPRKGKESKGKE